MEGWEEILVKEENALNENILKLESFIKGEKFDMISSFDKNDLKEQLLYMRNYRMVLRRRMVRHGLIE